MAIILQRSARSALISMTVVATAALARDISTPDWPCVQRKVENVTSTQIWEGPPVEDITSWRDNPEIRTLVATIANRRTPIGDAEAALKRYAEHEPDASRAERLTQVFAGLFATLQAERRMVIGRIESYRKAQGERALELERQSVALADLEEKAANDATAAKELEDAQARFDFAQRIFQERQNSIPFACEVPVRIDQRALTLGKSIHDLMAPAATVPAPQ